MANRASLYARSAQLYTSVMNARQIEAVALAKLRHQSAPLGVFLEP